MTYAKVALAMLVLAGGTGIYWAIKENGRLSAELERAVDVNTQINNALSEQVQQRHRDEKALLEREAFLKKQDTTINELKRKLRNVEITEAEKECLISDVPPAIVDFLRVTEDSP